MPVRVGGSAHKSRAPPGPPRWQRRAAAGTLGTLTTDQLKAYLRLKVGSLSCLFFWGGAVNQQRCVHIGGSYRSSPWKRLPPCWHHHDCAHTSSP